jgi:ribosomal protein L9
MTLAWTAMTQSEVFLLEEYFESHIRPEYTLALATQEMAESVKNSRKAAREEHTKLLTQFFGLDSAFWPFPNLFPTEGEQKITPAGTIRHISHAEYQMWWDSNAACDINCRITPIPVLNTDEADEIDRRKAEVLAARIEEVQLTFIRHTNPESKADAPVTDADLVYELEKWGISIDKRKITLGDPLEQFGDYVIPIKLHRAVTGQLKVSVVENIHAHETTLGTYL